MCLICASFENEDIAGLMRECPEAACALLDYCSLEPEVTLLDKQS